jgi:hydrogenase maturation factor
VHLIQILLPLFDNEGRSFGPEVYRSVRDELSTRFGGLTAFSRAPAEGLWRDEGSTHRDEIVVYEVMADELDAVWWHDYRDRLEQRFRQDAVVVRAQEIRLL